ncbi:ATP-dependent DNA helicase Q-like 2 [Magnolia sinica]|uniref:ATP-dependent DNA helicase Q-like 2 n=1 Tax=Magnolia sinica TaxID=86752 RepID=UPI0026588E72|nr:ATP-dependent DNA helicase Q-like 2 [Magnolia sinica]
MSSGLEMKLDELRKELSSSHEGILPDTILSTQKISMLSAEKLNSMEQLRTSLVLTIIGVVFKGLMMCEVVRDVANYFPTAIISGR